MSVTKLAEFPIPEQDSPEVLAEANRPQHGQVTPASNTDSRPLPQLGDVAESENEQKVRHPAWRAADRPVFLLVGDSHFHQVHAGSLRSCGIEVVEVVGVDGVIDTLQTHAPFGAIVELKRGTAAAFAVLEGLRRLRPGLPLIVSSHQPSITEAVKVMQLGADSYVPWETGVEPRGAATSSPPSELMGAVEMVIHRKRTVPPIDRTSRLGAVVADQGSGNVRELENTLERFMVVSQGRAVTMAELPPESRRAEAQAAGVQTNASDGEVSRNGAPVIPGASFREIERHAILTTYEACGRSPSRTSEILGLSLRTVHYRLREYRGETGRRTRGIPLRPPAAPAPGDTH